MRAVVRRSTSLVCDDIPAPVPREGQLLVRTLACGICGSDLHALQHAHRVAGFARKAGAANFMDPDQDVVFGHEFCAEVLDHGPSTARRLRPGARVVSMPTVKGPGGPEALGFSNRFPGGFAERMVLTEGLALEVPNGLSPTHAALTEPFAVGAHAVARAALDGAAAALVVGCGPVGLAVVAALKARGFGPVVAADFSPARRRVAERMGADVVVDPAVSSPYARWADLGVPADLGELSIARSLRKPLRRAVIFECVGAPGVLQRVIEGAPPEAQIVVVGVCMQTDSIEPVLAINKQLDFRFVYGYRSGEFAQTLRDLAEGRIDPAPLVSDVVGLSETAGAFEALRDPERQVKIVVEPQR